MKLSLRYKAALFIALTEFALLGLLVLTNLYQTRSDLEEQLRQRAHATAELVAASATEPVLSSDLAQIRNLLAGVVHKHQVRYAAVTDHRERLLAEAGQRAEPASVIEVAHPISVADTLFGRVTLQVARAETEAALAKTTRSNLIIAGLAMGLVAFISLTLGWFLTRNLAALARGVEAVRQGITPRASACGHATRSAISPRASMTWRRSWNRPSAIWLAASSASAISPTTLPTGCGRRTPRGAIPTSRRALSSCWATRRKTCSADAFSS